MYVMFFYPFISQWTLGLFPYICCDKHWGKDTFLDPDFNSVGYIP